MKINSISNNNFKGVYISNSLNLMQYDLAKNLQQYFVKSGLSDKFEKEGKDILLVRANDNGISVLLKPYSIKRILDDDFSRWNGRIFG